MEAQISKTPVWLRHTADFLRGEGSNEIKLWSDVKSKTTTKATTTKKLTASVSDKKELIKEKPDLNIQILSAEIESELKQVEKDWEKKFKLNEEKTLEKN